MRLANTWVLAGIFFCWPFAAGAQLRLLPDNEQQCVFGQTAQKINLIWHNSGNEIASLDIRARILQTSSATAVSLGEVAWKRVQVLPQQTILESAVLDFPTVKAKTRFLVLWLENTNQVIGTTAVWVYPTNLLAELKPMLGGVGLGVFDPQNELKPLLKNLKLDFTDLENSGLENFSGKLAIIEPFQSKAKMREGLAGQIKAFAKNTAVVWLLAPPEKPDKLTPSFYSVMEGTNSVVVVQNSLVDNLVVNPRAQLNLVYFCELALNPTPFSLPNLTLTP